MNNSLHSRTRRSSGRASNKRKQSPVSEKEAPPAKKIKTSHPEPSPSPYSTRSKSKGKEEAIEVPLPKSSPIRTPKKRQSIPPLSLEKNFVDEEIEEDEEDLFEKELSDELFNIDQMSDSSSDHDSKDHEEQAGALRLMMQQAQLQGFLSSLGASGSFEDFLSKGNVGRQRVNQMLEGISAVGDETTQMQSVMELCDYLSIGTEESMGGFRADQFVPPLVDLLNYEHNPDLMLFATRALTYMIEALPNSSSSIVQSGALDIFCARMLAINYIDVAEQTLQALEKLSADSGVPMLRAGAMAALLTLIGFFPLGVQRSAVMTAANICRRIPNECFDSVCDVAPILTGLLTNSDPKMVEGTLLCIARIAQVFGESRDRMENFASSGLVSHLVQIMSGTAPVGVLPTCHGLILKTLTMLCHASPILTLALLRENIVHLLKGQLSGGSDLRDSVMSAIELSMSPPSGSNNLLQSGSSLTPQRRSPFTSSKGRSTENLIDILSLINELMPNLPEEHAPVATSQGKYVIPSSKPEKRKSNSRDNFFIENPEQIKQIGEGLFDSLIDIYNSNVNPRIRYKCLSCIAKTLHFSTSDMLRELLRDLAASSFIAAMLASTDLSHVGTAIRLACILMEKLPDIFSVYFQREGVTHEIERLAGTIDAAESVEGQNDDVDSAVLAGDSDDDGEAEENLYQRLMFGAPREALRTSFSDKNPELTNEDAMAQWIQSQAKQFQLRYFANKAAGEETQISDQLKLLKSYTQELQASKDLQEDRHILDKIAELLLRGDGVSTFEFLQSGFTKALLKFLASHPERWEIFERTFFQPKNEQHSQDQQQQLQFPRIASHTLVEKLRNSINQLENFPVLCNEQQGSNIAALKFLTQPMKLRLQSNDKNLKDLSGQVVYMEPLATVSAIQEFLSSRVQQSSSSSSGSSSYPSPKKKSKSDSAEISGSLFRKSSRDSLSDSPSRSSRKSSRSSGETSSIMADDNDELQYMEDSSDEALSKSPKVHEFSGSPIQRKLRSLISPSRASSDKSKEKEKDKEGASSPQRADSAAVQSRLQLFIQQSGDHLLPLNPSHTIFQVLQKQYNESLTNSTNISNPGRDIWEKEHTIVYKMTENALENFQEISRSAHRRELYTDPLVQYIQTAGLELNIKGASEELYDLFALFNFLVGFNTLREPVDKQNTELFNSPEWVNPKLDAKLVRQLRDPLTLCSASLPLWCSVLADKCKFMFPFEHRKLLFRSTAMGLTRALHALQEQSPSSLDNHDGFKVGRIQRQKVRIARTNILKAANKVFELYGKSKAVLEVEYFGEEGTGLGPTLEFYALVSRELQRQDLRLWLYEGYWNASQETPQDSTNGPVYAFCPSGLFPAPVSVQTNGSEEVKKVCDLFGFIGKFVAKALLDERLLDLPFSVPFYKSLLGIELDLFDLRLVYPSVGATLVEFLQLLKSKRNIEQDSNLSAEEQRAKIEKLDFRGAPISALGLTFVLPGCPNWKLKEGGEKIEVDIHNLEEYVDLVSKAFLETGITAQMEAFTSAFAEVLPLESLDMFSVPELDSLICGWKANSDELWQRQELLEAVKCDYGYSLDSTPVQNFISILTEFTPEQRSKFIKFVTGSAKLPIGGFKQLNPRMTIVKKNIDDDSLADHYLPSVMTCVNNVKLPAYSNKAVMLERLLFAIEEGQGSFHLS